MFHRRLRLKQQLGKQGLERRKNSKKCRFLYSVDFCKNVDFEVFFSVSSSQGSLCLVYLTNQVRSLPFSQVLGMLWHPSHFESLPPSPMYSCGFRTRSPFTNFSSVHHPIFKSWKLLKKNIDFL